VTRALFGNCASASSVPLLRDQSRPLARLQPVYDPLAEGSTRRDPKNGKGSSLSAYGAIEPSPYVSLKVRSRRILVSDPHSGERPLIVCFPDLRQSDAFGALAAPQNPAKLTLA
jgi:hypothetical protein